MEEKKKRVDVKIVHGDEGFYTDNVTIFHNPNKFVIDFSQTTPRFDNIDNRVQQTFTVHHKTIVLDPVFAKILLKTLDQNVKKFEETFGAIKMPKKKDGDKEVILTEPEGFTKYIG